MPWHGTSFLSVTDAPEMGQCITKSLLHFSKPYDSEPSQGGLVPK